MKIVAAGCHSYDTDQLASLLSRAFQDLAFSPGGAKVLLKPNLLAGRPVAKAVNTDPRLVHALAVLLKQDGCEVWVGDSPGFESTERALEKSGIGKVMRDLDLRMASFEGQVMKTGKELSPYKQFLFGEDPESYDLVINMPKLKTHSMMGLTGGVKNTFGFVPRFEKARWHLRCGTDSRLFAAVLVDIHAIVSPALTVLDGITGMEGDGPSSGRPRDFGLIAVSESSFALDLFLEEKLQIPVPLPVNEVVREKGLVDGYEVVDWGMPVIGPVKMPKAVMSVQWNLKGLVGETVRKLFVAKPTQNSKTCTACAICVQVCPPGALKMENGRLRFDYKKCIRCYCCQEMCPTGAIRV